MRLLLYGGTFDPPHNGHLNNLIIQIGIICAPPLPGCARTGWW